MNEKSYRESEQRLWAESGAEPTERLVRLPRQGVKVRIQEVGDGPAVLFVHGGPSAGAGWAPLAARLPGFRCLVLDRPGTGLSEPFHWRGHALREFFETLVVDVLDALELPKAHLVGSSTGSDFVLHAGARYPDRVLRSVHFGCPGFAPGIHVPFVQRLMSQPGLWRLIAKMPTNEKGMASVMRQMGHGVSLDAGRFPHSILEWGVALSQHTPTMYHEMQGSSLLLSLRGIRPSLLFTKGELAAVQSPSYFLWGENDGFGDVAVGRRMVELMPNAQLEALPGAGHLAWLDAPDHAASVTAKHLLAQEMPAAVA
jgi:2-hydroxy-6-oxonona-2,4-dienedioate hydrolase